MKYLLISIILISGLYACKVMKNTNDNTEVSKPKTGINVGDKVPNIVMKSPGGKTYKLHKLKGKYIFLDFWASWCGPCRRENPNVVAAYRKYKNAKFDQGKGFTIYSVSLDKDVNKWKQAIDKDGLKWEYHVSDLQGWKNVAAQEFNVSSIPSNYLIAPDLTIIAKNLRGQRLHEVIDEHIESL